MGRVNLPGGPSRSRASEPQFPLLWSRAQMTGRLAESQKALGVGDRCHPPLRCPRCWERLWPAPREWLGKAWPLRQRKDKWTGGVRMSGWLGGGGGGGRTWPKSAERLWGGQVSAPLNGRFHARKNEGRRREHGPQQVRWTRPFPASHRGRAWGRGQLPGPRPREWLPGEAGRVPQGRWKAGVQQRL